MAGRPCPIPLPDPRVGEPMPRSRQDPRYSPDDPGDKGRDPSPGPDRSTARGIEPRGEFIRVIIELLTAHAIFILDPDGAVVTWSRGGERIARYTEEEILGRPISIFYPEDEVDEGRPDEDLRRAARKGEFVREGWWLRKDGSRFWARVAFVALRNAAGDFMGYGIVLTDLTARKEAEDNILKLWHQDELILNAADEGIYGIDMNDRTTFVNPAAERMLGWSEDELVGKPVHEMIHHTKPDGTPYPAEECPITTVCRSGISRHVTDEVFWRKDGTNFPVEYRCTPIVSDGQVVGTVITFNDITERKETERALASSEARLRRLIETSYEGIWIIDPDARTTFTNQRMAEILGYASDEMQGRPYFEFLGEEAGIDARRFMERRRSGHKEVLELPLRRKDGSTVWTLISTNPIYDGKGEFRGAIAMVTDIDDRKRIEEKLKESESWFRTIFERAGVGISLIDLEGRMVATNPALQRLIDYPEDELRGKPFVEITYPDDVAMDQQLFNELVAGERDVYQIEKRYIRRDGRVIWVRLTVTMIRGARGEPLFSIAMIEDITDRKRAEEAQRYFSNAAGILASSIDYDETVQNAARVAIPFLADLCAIYVVDEEGVVNRAAVAHKDPEKEAMLRATDLTLLDPGAPFSIHEVIRNGRSELVPVVTDDWLTRWVRDPDRLHLMETLSIRSLMVVPLRSHGQAIGATIFGSTVPGRYGPEDLALAEDLASRAAFAIDNAHHYSKSREATRIRDEVLAVVSHDLRNPLNTISLSAGLLKELVPRDREAEHKQLAIIGRSVERANRLIQDLLDVAKAEAGQLTISPTRIEPAPLVVEAVDLHRAIAEEKGIEIGTRVSDRLLPIRADRDRIVQAFANLIGNAIKFTPVGGRITVGAERAGDEIRFSVSDTGPGIAKEDFAHLFDAFWQARKGAVEGGRPRPPHRQGDHRNPWRTDLGRERVGEGDYLHLRASGRRPAARGGADRSRERRSGGDRMRRQRWSGIGYGFLLVGTLALAGCEPVPRVGGEAAGEIGEITEDVPIGTEAIPGEEVIQLSDFRPAPAAGAAPIKGWLRVVAPGPNPDRVRLEAHVTGLSPGAHAWHVHDGPCGGTGSVVVALTPTATSPGLADPLVADDDGVADQVADVPARELPLSRIRARSYSVQVHSGFGDDFGPAVACAEL